MGSSENEIETHSAESENRSGGFSESNVVLIKEFDLSSESSSYSDSSEVEPEAGEKKDKENPTVVASTYSHIHKLIRYLKVCTLSYMISKKMDFIATFYSFNYERLEGKNISYITYSYN